MTKQWYQFYDISASGSSSTLPLYTCLLCLTSLISFSAFPSLILNPFSSLLLHLSFPPLFPSLSPATHHAFYISPLLPRRLFLLSIPAYLRLPPPTTLKAPAGRRQSLHLTNNLTRPTQTLDHLLALLPSPDGVVAFLEEVVELVGSVHVFEEFALHFVFCVSG